jgi:hypothetical protein
MYIKVYNMYMALHIADPEVSALASEFAKMEGTTKTEALRRLLREAVAERKKHEKRAGFFELGVRIGDEARRRGLPPVTKDEMDDLWGMDQLDGD